MLSKQPIKKLNTGLFNFVFEFQTQAWVPLDLGRSVQNSVRKTLFNFITLDSNCKVNICFIDIYKNKFLPKIILKIKS